VWALGGDRFAVRAPGHEQMSVYVHLPDGDLGGPLAAPKAGNKVATQATETDRNTPQPVALQAA
jgi:hypothetical protein